MQLSEPDFSRAHLWDASAIAALDAIEAHYRRHDVELSITGLNDRSDHLHQTLSGQMAATH
jgi:SulP family sulfate permease